MILKGKQKSSPPHLQVSHLSTQFCLLLFQASDLWEELIRWGWSLTKVLMGRRMLVWYNFCCIQKSEKNPIGTISTDPFERFHSHLKLSIPDLCIGQVLLSLVLVLWQLVFLPLQLTDCALQVSHSLLQLPPLCLTARQQILGLESIKFCYLTDLHYEYQRISQDGITYIFIYYP